MSGDFGSATQTDDQLAEIIQSRESSAAQRTLAENAFEELYRRHAGLLLAFVSARVSTRSDAADLAQEMWVRVWTGLQDAFKGGNFRAWLHQIARNLIIDLYRKKRTSNLPENADPVDLSNEVESELHAERTARLRFCMDKLDEDRAQVVRARLTGLSYDEICRNLDINFNTAQTRFHRAKQELKKCVKSKPA